MFARRIARVLGVAFCATLLAHAASVASSATATLPGNDYEDGELVFHEQRGVLPMFRGERFVEIQWGAPRWNGDAGSRSDSARVVGRCVQKLETPWPVDSACVIDGRSLLVTGLDGDDVVIERWEFAWPERAPMVDDCQAIVSIELASKSLVVRIADAPQRRIASLVAVRRQGLPMTHVLALGAATPRVWQMELATGDFETLASGDSVEGRLGLVPYFHEVRRAEVDSWAPPELGNVYTFSQEFGCVIQLGGVQQSGFQLIDSARAGRIDRARRWTFVDGNSDLALELKLHAEAKRARNR